MGSYFNARLGAHGAGQRVALAGALHDVFVLSLGIAIATLVVCVFIREIPLRRTSGLDEATSAAAAAAAAIPTR